MEQWFGGGAAAGEPVPSAELLARLGWALALGTALAWRPLSRLAGGRLPKPQISHAVVLLCAAAALVVLVIGDSLARAFGVVGLGSFIRFRTAIKDPSDMVVFFVAIGVGMACGLGVISVASIGTAVFSLVLVVRDRAAREWKDNSKAGSEPMPSTPAVPAPEEVRL
ncbi:MAG TPA: DUF4956 domain-containing protein [Planctomycetota bacterium]|nr:DUF4956 domain-containing protein [Planctomycetota bacterium]